MPTNSTKGIQEILTFPFKDPRWVTKFFIAFGLFLANFIIPILPGILLAGYAAVMIREILRRDGELVLPEWNDWNRFLVDGIKYVGAGFIYMIPAFIFLTLGMFSGLIPVAAAPLLAQTTSAEDIWPFFALQFGSMGVMWLFFGIGVLVSLVCLVFSPPALTHVAARGEFSAAFRFKEWWPIWKSNLGGYLVFYLFLMGLSTLLMVVFQALYLTVVLCCLIPIVTVAIGVYFNWIYAAFSAQVYREGLGQTQEPHPLAASEASEG